MPHTLRARASQYPLPSSSLRRTYFPNATLFPALGRRPSARDVRGVAVGTRCMLSAKSSAVLPAMIEAQRTSMLFAKQSAAPEEPAAEKERRFEREQKKMVGARS